MNDTQESSSSGANAQTVSANQALAACTEAWVRVHHKARKNNEDDFDARERASVAYLQALPPLSGIENIRAFIACVAHGLAIGVIEGSRASRLLYAAQVAKSVLRQPAATRSAGNKSEVAAS